jgi:heat shock protein HslJ
VEIESTSSLLYRRFGLLVYLLVWSLLIVGCAFSSGSSSPPSLTDTVENALPNAEANLAVTAAPLANTPWVLAAFSNPQLNPRLDVNLITIQFAIDGSSVSGASACNDYFATYEVDHSSLIIRELGTVMMTCDETKMTVEETFFESLAEVRGYQIEGETLTLTNDAGEMLLRFKVTPYTKSTSFTREELANASYQSEFVEGGWVTLVNSEYHTAMKDSAAQLIIQLTYHMAFGDLDGDGIEDAAVVLVTNVGGSGIFYDLAVVKKNEAGLTNTAMTRLGDRILVRDIVIHQGGILVDMLVASAGHITCCPDAPVENHYRLEGSELVLEE